MKLVHQDTNLFGFTSSRTYRCTKCSTENRKDVNDHSDITCQFCKRVVKQEDVKK